MQPTQALVKNITSKQKETVKRNNGIIRNWQKHSIETVMQATEENQRIYRTTVATY